MLGAEPLSGDRHQFLIVMGVECWTNNQPRSEDQSQWRRGFVDRIRSVAYEYENKVVFPALLGIASPELAYGTTYTALLAPLRFRVRGREAVALHQ